MQKVTLHSFYTTVAIMVDLASCQMCLLSILNFAALCYATNPHLLLVCGKASYLRISRALRGLNVKGLSMAFVLIYRGIYCV